MSAIEVTLMGDGECLITHRESGARIRSSMAPEYGGIGGAFSSTDLLAGALGSCIATNLEPVARRHDIPFDAITVGVDKRLGTSPKRIDSLTVAITIGLVLSSPVQTRLERAAELCLVHRSLSSDVSVTIGFQAATS